MASRIGYQEQLELFDSVKKVVNVASVPQRSPFRYPGGKTWAIPVVRKWLATCEGKSLVEPFVGGGIVSLTAVAEGYVESALMVELDEEISAVWETIVSKDCDWLIESILDFDLNHENVERAINQERKSKREIALCTILKNRTYHGGILAKGSGFLKHGENGKGIRSRWYPETLAKRLRDIKSYSAKLHPKMGDAYETIDSLGHDESYCFFIDPPYFKAGKRLYTHFDVDHDRLFQLVSRIQGNYLLTYDSADEIIELANKYQLPYTFIPMKTTHHLEKMELLVSNSLDWLV